MGAPHLRLIVMGTNSSTARKIMRVNIVILAICIPLLILCLVRQLWFPAAVFAFLSLSNGYQYRTTKQAATDVEAS